MTNKYMYFIANWKMFGVLNSLNTLNRVVKFFKNFKKRKSLKIIYCPPSTLIEPMSKKLRGSNIEVGAQNCHEQDVYGAFTGSVNSSMLKSVGAKYIIIGHSENRQAGETDKLINLKIKSALKSGLRVIFCIGETLKAKRKKITKSVLNKQIKAGLKNIKNNILFLIFFKPALICLFKTLLVIFFLFALSVSPIQKITLSPDFNALLIFRFINLSVSPACLFSEWPIIIYLAPTLFNIDELTEPVKAP